MKVKVEVDATPQELRSFLGLPDVEPLQEEVMDHVRQNMLKAIEHYDPAALMKAYIPPNIPAFEAMHKSFWDIFARGLKKEPSEKQD